MNLTLPSLLLLATFFSACATPSKHEVRDESPQIHAVDAASAEAGSMPSRGDVASVRAMVDIPEPGWVKGVVARGSARPLPAAVEALVFPEGEQPNLIDLMRMWSARTGVETMIDVEMERILAATKASIPASRSVAARDVQSFVQMQLKRSSCYLVRVGGLDSTLVAAVSAGGRGGSGLRSNAAFVNADELSSFADQHAFLIQTVLELPGLDTRQLSTSLRSLLTDTNTQNLISVGTHSIVLQGTGAHVLQVARTLAAVSQHGLVERKRLTQGG